MDHTQFDRLAAALGNAASRRAGVKAALALMAGAGAAHLMHDDAGARRRNPSRPQAATRADVIDERRPCGPTAKDNACRKNKDCCTKYCKPPKGKQKIGRCRCIKPGKKCKHGQVCCGGATCVNRICTPPPTCGAAGSACASDAACCSGLTCESGSCAPCVAAVCASGCPFTTVEAAYAASAAGSTIHIGPGTYTTLIEASKDMTLAACPGVTGVILQPDPAKQSVNGNISIVGEDPGDASTKRTITLRNLTLQGTGIPAGEVLLDSGANGTLSFTIDGCTVKDAYGVVNGLDGEFVIEDSALSGCSYALNLNGVGATVLNITNSQFTNFNTSQYNVYISAAASGSATISGSTFTTGYYAVYLKYSSGPITVENTTISGFTDGSLTITGNLTAASRSTTPVTVTNVTVSGCGYGPGFYGGVVQVTGSSFTSNTPNGELWLESGDFTLTDTTVSGNTEDDITGGIQVNGKSDGATLTMAGTTAVTGNTGTTVGGVGVALLGGSVTVTGSSSSRVSGNTGTYQCGKCTDPTDCGAPNKWSQVDCATFV